MSGMEGLRFAVLTVSDRVAAGSRDDAGGDALRELIGAAGATVAASEVVAAGGRGAHHRRDRARPP